MALFLSDRQIDKLSDISADIGQVFFASMGLPFVIDMFNPLVAVFGLAISIAFWVISVMLQDEPNNAQ